MGSDSDAVTFFVLYCDKDDSHSVKKQSEVLYDESITVGDAVTFYHNSTLWHGTVKAMGDDEDDMCRICDELNADKPRREPSFHVDKPRRAAVTCRLRQESLTNTHRSRKKAAESKSHGVSSRASTSKSSSKDRKTKSSVTDVPPKRFKIDKPKSVLEKLIHDADLTSSDSESEIRKPQQKDVHQLSDGESESAQQLTDVDDDASEPEITVEEAVLLQKLSKQNKKADFQELLSLARKQLASKPKKKSLTPPAEPSLSQNNCSSSSDDLPLSSLSKTMPSLTSTGNLPSKHSEKEKQSTHLSQPSSSKNDSRTNNSNAMLPKTLSCSVSTPRSLPKLMDREKRSHLTPESQSPKIHSTHGTPTSSTFTLNQPEVERHIGSDSDCDDAMENGRNTTNSIESPNTSRQAQDNDGKETPSTRNKNAGAVIVKQIAKRKKYPKLVFPGEYFCYKKDDPDVVKLHAPFEIYVAESELKKLRLESQSVGATARNLVKLLFTEEAQMACSVTGRPAAGKGREHMVLRPPLHSEGVRAIFEFCKARAARKGWKEPDFTSVKKSMADILSETRTYKMLQEETVNIPE